MPSPVNLYYEIHSLDTSLRFDLSKMTIWT